MKKFLLFSGFLLTLVGCGSSNTAGPATDPDVIRRAEEQHNAAGKAEGNTKPEGSSGK